MYTMRLDVIQRDTVITGTGQLYISKIGKGGNIIMQEQSVADNRLILLRVVYRLTLIRIDCYGQKESHAGRKGPTGENP